MPLYILHHDASSLTLEEKKRVARGITDAHVKATGIAPFLVKVVLHGGGEGDFYTGGEVDTKSLRLVGNVRRGRDTDNKRELLKYTPGSYSTCVPRLNRIDSIDCNLKI